MRAASLEQEHKKSHVVDQLAKYGYTDVNGKSYKELRHKLAVIRAMEIDVSKSDNRWF